MDETHHHQGHSHSAARAYWMLGLNLLLSLIVMYLVMYTMIDGWPDYRNNINMLYMALTMWAPMGILMIVTMGSMYQNARTNIVLYAVFALVTLGSFWATRSQALVDDRQFIQSMVPHHSGAILMCREAKLVDPELVKLCQDISQGQRREIEQMNAIAARLR
ncbi:conserved membrane hypothetical protein [Bosea sp. 62]|nr:conserved membrane hypothetical protein [Bosea sp. 21B]CAD5292695.1 conserved membrane hypothetical protein [Bosea sp. 46]CAD5300060.1 conserved membrane hypothetical protein [Bosea sp. 7B]VVT57163.1 conserved membrane hypothetical protein [Bosea sp. EC-HK365B]VXB50155.1 conserved membrane hypothetical protein [Bosea sp. 127]VXC69022.1 conserved membrane hypothetical protein [Bosea sp. 29B]VXC95824.1 conserved membrane hypothetical protein [Bosea sp. 62]